MKLHRGNSGFSLNRDLRYHFTYLYVVGHHLMNAIVGAMSKIYSFQFPPSIRAEEKSERQEQVAERIQRLPFLFFPDEVSKPTPTVYFRKENGEVELTLDSTSVIKALSPGNSRVIISYQGDSVTKSWRLPYIGYPPEAKGKLINLTERLSNP